MTGFGQTNDPRALITGDPGAVYETEAQLRQYAEVLLEAGVGLRRIDTSDGWRGAAADAFRRIYDDQPGKWLRAGDAFQSAADALGGYAATLGWAQDAAATAIGLWNAGDKQAASDTLASAQSQLAAAGDAAAAVVGRARDQAPPGPSIWDDLTSGAGSVLSGAGHFLSAAGRDTVGVLASLGNAAWHDFKGEAEVIASAFRVASGLGDIIEDECEVDLPVFEEFLAAAARQYQQTAHPILRSLMTGFLATAMVLAERAGGQLPDTSPEQTAAWAQLREEHARSMSR